MKISVFATALAASLSLASLPARADLEVSAGINIHAEADFYAPLAPQGEWVEVGAYGRCWHPTAVAVGWRPYCDGHWEWTDCGWYWASDEPWAWACYHYGGWVYDPVYFWVWVPAVEWAPAWVTWRVGGGYVGWAPLPPHRVSVAVSAPAFVFVESARFHQPVRPNTVVVNNTTIINRTAVINNNITRETRSIGRSAPQKVVINNGPGVEMVQKATGRQFKPVPIQEAARQTAAPASLSRERKEFERQDRPSSAPEPPKRAPEPEYKLSPAEKERPPAVPPETGDRKQAPEKPDLTPAPERRPGQPALRDNRPKAAPPGKGHEKDQEGHGKGKDKDQS